MVVLCFGHPATNGYQALAMPGSNKEAIRAKLGQMTVKKLKERTRKRGLIVSGRKSALVDRSADDINANGDFKHGGWQAQTSSDRSSRLRHGCVPSRRMETVQILEQRLKDPGVAFLRDLRAGVASGNSTLAGVQTSLLKE